MLIADDDQIVLTYVQSMTAVILYNSYFASILPTPAKSGCHEHYLLPSAESLVFTYRKTVFVCVENFVQLGML